MTDEEPEKTYHVRLSRPGDKLQEMRTELVTTPRPGGGKPIKEWKFVDVVETDHLVDMDPRKVVRRSMKKYNMRALGITFAHKERVHYGETSVDEPVTKPVLQAGKPMPGAVQEYDIPESLLYQLKDGVNRGCLVVEGDIKKHGIKDVLARADEEAAKPQLKYTSKALGDMTAPEVRGIAVTEYKLDVEGKAKSALAIEIMEAQGVEE